MILTICVCVTGSINAAWSICSICPNQNIPERDEILQILENGFKTGNAYKVHNTSNPGEDWL